MSRKKVENKKEFETIKVLHTDFIKIDDLHKKTGWSKSKLIGLMLDQFDIKKTLQSIA